ncbi:C2H2 type zinc finger domain-containing protein [Diplocarpon rosae]|nr:C2H2 type zinc finger domain-containing protein [Diplocarpon rosae]
MDLQRGRSLSSGGQQHHIKQSHSPASQSFQDPSSLGLGVGLENRIQGNEQQFLNNNFNPNNTFANNEFMNQQTQSFTQGRLGESAFIPTTDFNQQFKQEEPSSPYNQPQLGSFTQDLMNATSGFHESGDFPLFPANPAEYDPSFFTNVPPPGSRNQSVNPSQLGMSSPQTAPTPSGKLLQPDSHPPASVHNSPNFSTSQFKPSPSHSRHASLGPESAAFPQGQTLEWSMIPSQFTSHRRSQSEFSDISIPSAHHSPNLGHHDSFDAVDPLHSPMQRAQDALYENVLGIGNFSLSDNQVQHGASPGRGLSPAHSPAISPRMGPQQLPNMGLQNPLYLMNNNGYGSNMIYSQGQQEAFPQLHNDIAQSQQMRRQSTSSLPNRDYILGLADPEYQPSAAEIGNAKRVQKHPATFQCTLCPKRFTRAYNLRSHLRTHTDERPFVCTVCGKAFARQHDRKRHEGLHSGEKKFVCKGELKQGGSWGCGRRFARADALGRHFRSEAGRICIKPLLDEEAIERQRVWNEQRMQDMQNMQQSQPLGIDPNGFPIDASGNYTLPAALLAQYPALAGLSWSDVGQGDAGLDDDPSGRSSFDASGSEFYDEDNEGGYVSSGPGQQGYRQPQSLHDGFNGYSSDIGGR